MSEHPYYQMDYFDLSRLLEERRKSYGHHQELLTSALATLRGRPEDEDWSTLVRVEVSNAKDSAEDEVHLLTAMRLAQMREEKREIGRELRRILATLETVRNPPTPLDGPAWDGAQPLAEAKDRLAQMGADLGAK